jgi:hypothetical protein
MAMTSVVVIAVLSIIDNVDIPDIDVVVGELVCCVVLLVVVGIGVGGHVRGKQLVMQIGRAQLSNPVGLKSIPVTNHLNVAHQAIGII